MSRAVLVVVFMLLCGCTSLGTWFPLQKEAAPTGVAEESALSGLAQKTGLALAGKYPPGRTAMHVTPDSGDFGLFLESELRTQGFSLDDGKGLRVTSLLDRLETSQQGMELWYLLVRVSDGYSFGQVYSLKDNVFSPVGVQTQTSPFVIQKGQLAASTASHLEEWLIKPGDLRYQLAAWCGRTGYQLFWEAEHDFTMHASTIFRDSFPGAVTRLFERMHQAGVGLRVTIYQDNKTLRVVEE